MKFEGFGHATCVLYRYMADPAERHVTITIKHSYKRGFRVSCSALGAVSSVLGGMAEDLRDEGREIQLDGRDGTVAAALQEVLELDMGPRYARSAWMIEDGIADFHPPRRLVSSRLNAGSCTRSSTSTTWCDRCARSTLACESS